MDNAKKSLSLMHSKALTLRRKCKARMRGRGRIATISAAIMCRRRTIHALELEADNRSVIVIKVCWRPSVWASGSARNNWLGTPTLWPKLPSLGQTRRPLFHQELLPASAKLPLPPNSPSAPRLVSRGP